MKINNVTLLKINEENAVSIFSMETATKIVAICNKTINQGQGALLGEDAHGTADHYSEISLRRVTHAIKNVRIEANKIVGDIMILSTPQGKMLKALVTDMLKSKINRILEDRENTDLILSIEDIGLKFTPRAIGTVDGNRNVILNKFLTFDFCI